MLNANNPRVSYVDVSQTPLCGYETEEIDISTLEEEDQFDYHIESPAVMSLGCEELCKSSESLLDCERISISPRQSVLSYAEGVAREPLACCADTPPTQIALLGATGLLTGGALVHLIANISAERSDDSCYIPIVFYVILGVACILLSKIGPHIPAVKSRLDRVDSNLRSLCPQSYNNLVEES
ncbi:hypothetical protein [Candidatus Ichthyocystis hellenicum]|uniref:hypothetical protein n=1 Tax=Candidatus Ichthyocystis hellenicum TaxID=1561003 RepID=UPI000B86AE91|nr:hypothetical protein [Candidatus Ichthyocystis hellenicum]